MPTRRFDVLLASALGVLFVAEILGESGFDGERPLSLAAAIVFTASLAWRRAAPVVPLALAVGLIELSNLAGPKALGDSAAFLFGILIAIYSAGAYAEGRWVPLCALLVAAAIPLAAIEPGEALTASNLGFFVAFFGGPFVAGRVIRRRRAREVELQAEGEQLAATAVGDERARIARELHDVVAHAVSVVLLQARGARKVLSDDEVEVRGALDTIERSASEALQEMRRLLSLLREQDEVMALAPQPSLRRLDALVDSVREAGLPVDVRVSGEVGDLPPGVDVSAYRIVQEGLTNALKHAGRPARARVVVERSGDELRIEVSDDGAGTRDESGSGHGLVGMRERVAVYGGRLEAGREPGGGYALRARLNVGSAR